MYPAFIRMLCYAIGIQRRNGQNCFAFLFRCLLLPVLLLEKLEKKGRQQWNISMLQTTYTARTHTKIKFINSYLLVNKNLFASNMLKKHPSTTHQQKNVHLNHFAAISVRADGSDARCQTILIKQLEHLKPSKKRSEKTRRYSKLNSPFFFLPSPFEVRLVIQKNIFVLSACTH